MLFINEEVITVTIERVRFYFLPKNDAILLLPLAALANAFALADVGVLS